jgi:putative intracellular protease/amidase
MLSGITGALLGANKTSKQKYQTLKSTSESFQKPRAWSDPSFKLEDYDLVFLPGGHEKGMRQLIDSARVHDLLRSYFPKTVKPSAKSLAAICHGVQVLAMTKADQGKSIISETKTTALPAAMEEGIFQATRLFLGDYYKTYGAGTHSVQKIVTDSLNDTSQFVSSIAPGPYVDQCVSMLSLLIVYVVSSWKIPDTTIFRLASLLTPSFWHRKLLSWSRA